MFRSERDKPNDREYTANIVAELEGGIFKKNFLFLSNDESSEHFFDGQMQFDDHAEVAQRRIVTGEQGSSGLPAYLATAVLKRCYDFK